MKLLNWNNLIWIGFGLVFARSDLRRRHDKRDRAVAIKVCDGLPVVKLEDGTTWLRYRWRYYRVEDGVKVC